jgi:hypothetical protein
MQMWFNNNLHLINDDNPSNPTKSGIIATYDDIKERYILTKKEPALINGQLQEFGFTVAYSLKDNMWVSFYSFIPNLYVSAPGRMYSWKANHNKDNDTIDIYEHNNDGNYQVFYGTYYPYIVEYIGKAQNMETTIWDNIVLNTDAKKYIASYQSGGKTIYTNEFVDERFVTFNKAIFYNSRQCTNIKELKPKEHLNTNESEFFVNYLDTFTDKELIILDKKEKDWTLNNLRDAVVKIEYPMWIKGLGNIGKTNLSMPDRLPGYIDKVLNQDVFGNKEWYDEEPLRDKYLAQRYVFYDSSKKNVQLTINYSVDNKTISYE